MGFTLSTDTSCDIFRNELKAAGVEYRPLVYTIDDVPYFDEFTADADYKAFYDLIRAGKMPTTSQINIAEHEEFFNMLCDKYDGEIVHITLSSGLSSTYESACAAAKTVNARYGCDRIYVVDSLGATITVRHVVEEAIRLRDAGVCAADAAKRLAGFTAHLHTWFMPTDLMHLRRGGRVSGASAVLGTALNIKPILTINDVGGLSVVQKVIGVGKGIKLMASKVAKNAASASHKIYVASADSNFAQELLDAVKAARPDCEAEIGWIGPVIGAHTGCGAAGVAFVSDKPRTEMLD